MFKGADPMHPVIFLNQSGYSIQNLKTKKRMVFYDTTRKILVKPSSLGGEAGSVDDMSVAVQQVLAAEGDTSKELGINESNKELYAAFPPRLSNVKYPGNIVYTPCGIVAQYVCGLT